MRYFAVRLNRGRGAIPRGALALLSDSPKAAVNIYIRTSL